MVADPVAPAGGRAISAGPRRRTAPDLFELLVLAAFGALSMWVVVENLRLASAHGLVWAGIDGFYPTDQLQYLAWIQDASRHVLISDLFVLHPTPHDYLQPLVAISGGLTALGVVPWLALLIWKPVAVIALVAAVSVYCRRLFTWRAERWAALVLALFATSYATVGDEWLPFISWGYVFALAAVAAMVGALLAYDHARRTARWLWLAPTLALLASWLHPWQGELLILVVIGGELLDLRGRRGRAIGRSIRLPTITVAAAALPILYYGLLRHYDAAWRYAASVTPRHPDSLWVILLPLAPLLVAAIPAYCRPAKGFLPTANRLWPLAALGVWALSSAGLGAGALHAWTGITIPLAVSAVTSVEVTGLRRVRGHQWIVAAAVLALIVPGTIHMMRQANGWVAPATHNPNLLTASEQSAFRYLRSNRAEGGVLSSYRLGDAVPGETGRHTYSGDDRWSGPGYETAERMAWELMHGWIRGRPARAFILGTGARFVLADCSSHADLARTLAPIRVGVRRFGCITVYELRPT